MTILWATGVQQVGSNWMSGTYTFALLTSVAAPDKTSMLYMAALATNESAALGYTRLTVASPGVTTDNIAGTVTFTCTNPDFGTIGSSGSPETIGWLVLFHDTGSDAASLIVAAYPISYVADGSTDAAVTMPSGAIFLTAGS